MTALTNPGAYPSVELACELLGHVQGMIEHADQKIHLLLAADAVLVALLTSEAPGLLREAFGRSASAASVAVGAITLSMLAAIGCSILFAFLSLKPRLEFGQRRSMFFFGHIAEKPVDAYIDEFVTMSEQQTVEDLLAQAHANSQIARTKFRQVALSTNAFIVGLALWVALLILRMLT